MDYDADKLAKLAIYSLVFLKHVADVVHLGQ